MQVCDLLITNVSLPTFGVALFSELVSKALQIKYNIRNYLKI